MTVDRPDVVQAAMAHVDRADFLPAALRDRAVADEPLPIGHGATNSQPTTVRNMLQLLDVRLGHRVLDVGCGSGWTTALTAELCGDPSLVWAVDLEPDLVAAAIENLARAGMADAHVAVSPPGVLGWPEAAPYERILVSAMATELPEQLVAQLTEGGVMVIPVAGQMIRATLLDGQLDVQRHGAYRFVPLR